MGDVDFNQTWSHTEVTGASPNEQAFVTIVGDSEIRVAFGPGYYERAGDAQMIDQLRQACAEALRKRTRAYLALRSRDVGRTVTLDRTADSPEDAEFLRRLDEIAVSGASADGTVRVSAVGARHFAVDFDSGLRSQIDGAEFARRVGQAATEALVEHIRKLREARFEVYYLPRIAPA